MSNRTPLTPLSESRINTINSPTKSLHQRHFKNNAQSNINSAKKQHNAFQGLQHLQFNERPSDQTRTSQFNEKFKDQTRSSQFNRADSDSSTTSFHRRRLLSTSRSSSVGLSSSPGIISSEVFANHQSLPSVIESNYSDKDHSCKSTSDFASPFAAHAQITGKKPMKLPSLNIHLDTLPPLAHSISNTESFMDSLTVPLAATSTKQTETKTLLSKAVISAEDNQKERVNVHTEENLRAPKLANSKMVCDKLQTRLLLAYYKYKTQTKTVNHLIQKQKHVSNTTPTKKKSAALNRTNKTVTPGREKAARSLLKLYGSSYV
ncbi:hypothetical protein ACO0QE_003730 [Hanseniaspora vineae]